MKDKISNTKGLSLFMVCLLAVTLVAMMACKDPLEVENPNSLVEEDLSLPTAAVALANGAQVTLARAAGSMYGPYTTATDEGTWIGSRDAWNQLNKGAMGDPNNEFVDAAWPFATEARFMADFAIDKLVTLKAAGDLDDPEHLALSYLYAAIIRTMVADMWDDFVISDRTDSQPAIGEDNMFQLYEQAIDFCTSGLAITSDAENRARLTAMRARAKNARAIWDMVNPRGAQPPANAFVDAGRDDAEAALGMVSADWKYQLNYSAATPGNDYSFQVNGRLELGLVADPTLQVRPEFHVPLLDPVDGVPDPRVLATIAEFRDVTGNGGQSFAPFTVVTEREMQVIIAESDIARGNAGAARAVMDALRARDGLSPVPAGREGELLQHERRAHLFLMGRRLADMYRFGVKSPDWLPNFEAAQSPGSFFAITRSEIESNPFVDFTTR
ncbi:hypothetical protein IH879_06745 [candidate division KSB1 bacterium]|nr:hypothetical protein [candidate division KSB1 bacterium]